MYCTCFFNVPAPTEIYTSCHTLSLHDALPIYRNSDGELWMVDTQNSAPPAPSERMPSNFCAAMKRSATMPMNSVDTIVAIPIRPNGLPLIVSKYRPCPIMVLSGTSHTHHPKYRTHTIHH